MKTPIPNHLSFGYTIFLFLIIASQICLVSCGKRRKNVVHKSEEIIRIDSTTDCTADTAYLKKVAELRKSMDELLDEVIGYAPKPMQAYLPESPLLNWACDALYDIANESNLAPVDFSVTNVGGLRCDWSAGDITVRSVYELMPFDNKLVVLDMRGIDVIDLCQQFVPWGGQGVSKQLRMTIYKGKAIDITINGEPVKNTKVYRVATSNYLAGGNDHLKAFKKAVKVESNGDNLRDVFIEYIRRQTAKGKPVAAQKDGRIVVKLKDN